MAVGPLRQPSVKLRPFFWNKMPWRPDAIWARVPSAALSEEQLSALEALFAQSAPSPQAKSAVSKGALHADSASPNICGYASKNRRIVCTCCNVTHVVLSATAFAHLL